jgi:uroporphyrinogen decarboxylase
MPHEMSPRERVLTAMRRQVPDRIPKELGLTPALEEEFARRAPGRDQAEYFRLETRGAGVGPSRVKHDYSGFFQDVHVDWIDNWGVGYLDAHFHHFWRFVHPLRNAQTVQDIMDYPLPDLTADYRWEGFADRVKAWQDRGHPVGVGPAAQLYEEAWYLRGQEQLLIDFHDNPELADALLDRILEIQLVAARRAAEAGADILRTGDDVGWQQGLLMSPAMFRRFLKPRYAKMFETVKSIKPDMLTYFHSDGNVEAIVPDLIEIGLDILNPVQPECMDPAEIKRKYGDRLAFWGTVGTQSTMPWGTVDEVRRVVKERIETVGPNGLLLAPTHVLEPEVPWENIEAFVEAVEEFGVVGR